MNTESLQESEEDGLIGLEEQNEISCLIRRFATEQFGYSRMRISSMQLRQKKPQTNVTVALNRSLIDLYLRFGEYAFAEHQDKKYIVVARIGFKKQKHGYGTVLLKELCIFGEKFGYEYLEVERPNPDCQAFMKKLGFKDKFYLSIDQLKRSIQEYKCLRKTN